MKEFSNISVYSVVFKDLVGYHYEEFKLNNRWYRIGDAVGLTPDKEDEPPFVCRIEKIYLPKSFVSNSGSAPENRKLNKEEGSNLKIEGRWYYRPHEIAVDHFTEANELFFSAHFDTNAAESIVCPVKIHYFKSTDNVNPDSIPTKQYFCRYIYDYLQLRVIPIEDSIDRSFGAESFRYSPVREIQRRLGQAADEEEGSSSSSSDSDVPLRLARKKKGVPKPTINTQLYDAEDNENARRKPKLPIEPPPPQIKKPPLQPITKMQSFESVLQKPKPMGYQAITKKGSYESVLPKPKPVVPPDPHRDRVDDDILKKMPSFKKKASRTPSRDDDDMPIASTWGASGTSSWGGSNNNNNNSNNTSGWGSSTQAKVSTVAMDDDDEPFTQVDSINDDIPAEKPTSWGSSTSGWGSSTSIKSSWGSSTSGWGGSTQTEPALNKAPEPIPNTPNGWGSSTKPAMQPVTQTSPPSIPSTGSSWGSSTSGWSSSSKSSWGSTTTQPAPSTSTEGSKPASSEGGSGWSSSTGNSSIKPTSSWGSSNMEPSPNSGSSWGSANKASQPGSTVPLSKAWGSSTGSASTEWGSSTSSGWGSSTGNSKWETQPQAATGGWGSNPISEDAARNARSPIPPSPPTSSGWGSSTRSSGGWGTSNSSWGASTSSANSTSPYEPPTKLQRTSSPRRVSPPPRDTRTSDRGDSRYKLATDEVFVDPAQDTVIAFGYEFPDEQAVKEAFADCGTVVSARIHDRNRRRTFITFSRPSEAVAAITRQPPSSYCLTLTRKQGEKMPNGYRLKLESSRKGPRPPNTARGSSNDNRDFHSRSCSRDRSEERSSKESSPAPRYSRDSRSTEQVKGWGSSSPPPTSSSGWGSTTAKESQPAAKSSWGSTPSKDTNTSGWESATTPTAIQSEGTLAKTESSSATKSGWGYSTAPKESSSWGSSTGSTSIWGSSNKPPQHANTAPSSAWRSSTSGGWGSAKSQQPESHPVTQHIESHSVPSSSTSTEGSKPASSSWGSTAPPTSPFQDAASCEPAFDGGQSNPTYSGWESPNESSSPTLPKLANILSVPTSPVLPTYTQQQLHDDMKLLSGIIFTRSQHPQLNVWKSL